MHFRCSWPRFISRFRTRIEIGNGGVFRRFELRRKGNFAPLLESSDLTPSELERIQALHVWSMGEQCRLARWFEKRKLDGFVRECHGDLHLRNIVRHRGRPCLFDCIEFNESFRWIDVMERRSLPRERSRRSCV